MLYRFEDFELLEDDFCLNRAGQRISLEPKSLRVLLLLVSRAGHLVDKRCLLDTVWDGAFVEENNLARTIAALRRELGDDSRKPRLIETVPTRGYRFIAPVQTRPGLYLPYFPRIMSLPAGSCRPPFSRREERTADPRQMKICNRLFEAFGGLQAAAHERSRWPLLCW